MDVRCEKCQTEYELDESRLKPGGVTVKCTNCGHMFKIRKRTITNVGTPPIATGAPPISRDGNEITRRRANSSKQPFGGGMPGGPGAIGKPRGESLFEDDARQLADDAPTTVDRQWLIRLENGEQKSCRELATLQQWIITSVVTRESLISRTGKTWKRLGDIADLSQYFTIADEARANRERTRPASRPAPPVSIKEVPGTVPGYSAAAIAGHGTAPQAAGGTILPDDDDDLPEARTTRSFQSRAGVPTPPPVPPRGAGRTPPLGSNAASPPPSPPAVAPHQVPVRRPRTTPPPPPPKRQASPTPPPPPPIPPQGNRATAMWATDGVPPQASELPASGPFVGKLAAIPDEPAFAGRVRMAPGDDATFDTVKVRSIDEDDGVLPARRGSRVGMLVLVMALFVMGAASAAVYVFVIRKAPQDHAAAPAKDAAVATVTPDAAAVVAPVDAAAPPPPSPLDAVRGELAADVEPRLRTAIQALDAKPEAPAQALRAHLIAQLAQDLQDRASVTADKAVADQLRKEAKQLVLDAATAAQRALKIAGDDVGANLAMAEVMRLQGKPARDGQRYLDTARGRPGKDAQDLARDLALDDALVLVRDGKLDDARAAFTAIDQGDGKLETSGDVRARFHLALVLAAQNKAAEAKPLVATILAAQPAHAGAKALAEKLETLVAKTDPLPPEDRGKDAGPGSSANANANRPTPGAPSPPPSPSPSPGPEVGGGESFERLLKRADALAETSCTKAMELYTKALQIKPQSVEALTGMGYCYIDAKLFASAHSEFRAALTVSSKYEPALLGIADAYRQQGLKDQAIEAYKACLEIHPGSVAAKRQLEQLGVTSAPPPRPSGGTSSTAPPPPTPTPAPPPSSPTAPEPSGAGSGSG